MSTLINVLGPTVREIRLERGWSQEHLAEISGLDRSYVGEIERSRVSPSLTVLEKLCLALGLPPSQLIGLCESRVTRLDSLVDSLQVAGDRP